LRLLWQWSVCVCFSAVYALGVAAAQKHIVSNVPSTHAAPNAPAPTRTGERAFQEHCSRCHTAPEQLSPRISGTVLMHMRVRANLTREDQRLILRYLAP
jgi:cytochrome c5